jgi:DNA-binding NarL/FixJ family response regulator
MRAGLAELLQGHPDLRVAGEAADGVEAVRLAAEIQPDVILMDVSMPRLDGIEATAEIRRRLPGIRIIGISMNTDAATRRKMRNAGASTLLSKAGSFENLIQEIRQTKQRLPCMG